MSRTPPRCRCSRARSETCAASVGPCSPLVRAAVGATSASDRRSGRPFLRGKMRMRFSYVSSTGVCKCNTSVLSPR